ncbi:MAG: Dihydroxyacetone kinase 2 [Chaenotheca gracillima]|nr:MAG: Dihydroxyacetone kinase 2 [Chaenotheca gracillima]
MGLLKVDFIPKMEVSLSTYFFIIFTCCVCPVLALFSFELSAYTARTSQPKGCRKIGLRVKSNLADEYDEKYVEGGPAGKDENGEDAWRIKSLWIYPIKSCTGVELNRGRMVGTGLEYDRQFSFAQLRGPNAQDEDKKWRFITQREFPTLAKVKPELWVPDPESRSYSPEKRDVLSEGVLVINYPVQLTGWSGSIATFAARLQGTEPMRSFRVPFNPTPAQIEENGYTKEKMTIWKESPEALNMGNHIPRDFARSLGLKGPITLFRVGRGNEREVFRSAPRKEELGRQPVTGFADAFPIHMQNLASVRDVAKRVEKDIPQFSAIRFRPNIIIAGPPAYTEDSWKRIRIGSHEFYVVCRTARCRLPNIDPKTAVRHPIEPDKTLKSFRCIDEGAGTNACLGMEMVAKDEIFDIRAGEPVEVLETGEHKYIPQ